MSARPPSPDAGLPPGGASAVDWRLVGGILFLAFALRFLFLFQLTSSPFGAYLPIDAAAYDDWGWRIANGAWIGDGAFYQSPGYPYFIGLIYSLFGHRPIVVQLIQIAAGTLSCLLFYDIGRRVFGERAGLLCLFISAVYLPFIFFDGVLMKAGLADLICLIALSCLLRAESAPGWAALGGGALGAAALFRGNFLLAAPVFPVWIWLFGVDRRRASRAILLFAGGLVVSILPATLHNLYAGRDFVLINYTAGTTFYIGNNPRATGIFGSVSDVRTVPRFEEADVRTVAEKKLGKKLQPSQISRFWFKRGLDFLLRNPGPGLRLFVKKVLLFWGRYEIPDNYNMYFLAKELLPFLRAPLFRFLLVFPLAVLGAAVSWRWNRGALLLMLMGGAYMLSVVAFYVTARYRLPIVIFLMPFAAKGILDIAASLRRPSTRRLAKQALILGAAALLCSVPVLDRTALFAREYILLGNSLKGVAEKDAWAAFEKGIALAKSSSAKSFLPEFYLSYGVALRSRGKLDRAVRCFYSSLFFDPSYEFARRELIRTAPRTAHFQRGIGLLRAGKLEAAKEELGLELSRNPRNADAWHNLGVVAAREGDWRKACSSFEKAVELNPYAAHSLAALSVGLRHQGDAVGAESAMDRYRELMSSRP